MNILRRERRKRERIPVAILFVGILIFGTANIINKFLETSENLNLRIGFDIRPNRGMYGFKPCNLGCKL